MKLGSMFGEIARSLFRKPATEKYPFERQEAPARFRGQVRYTADKCTGCMLCVKDCPADAIEIIAIDKPNKRFIMRYHMDRCTYCAQCVEDCRFDCIEMSNEQWELAALNKQPFTVTYGREEDIAKFLGKFTEAAPAEKP
jgi:formate hydrogenlyase subunit 6/NADH:ubiquinone oxidoreductase subunit I